MMIDAHTDLKCTVGSVRQTMSSVRGILKNAAILRNLTDLRPKINNATRWSGKCLILHQFTQMRDDLIEATEDPNNDIIINTTTAFLNKVSRYLRMLQEINEVSKSLQTENHTLSNCRDDLNTL